MKSLIRLYDELQMASLSKDEEALGLYMIEKDDAEQYLRHRTKDEIIRDLWENRKGEIFTLLAYGLLVIHVLVAALRYALGLATLKSAYFYKDPVYIFLWLVLPFAVWAVSTAFPMFNIRFRKIRLFYLALISDLLMCAHILAGFEFNIIVPVLFKIPLTTQISEGKVVVLTGAVLLLLSFIIPLIPLFAALVRFIELEPNKKELLYFKLLRSLDLRKNREYAYDYFVGKNLDTGAASYTKEHDRYLQSLTQGPTGSGKTSQIFLRQLMTDLDQIAHNLSCQKRGIAKMFADGSVRLTAPFDFKDDSGYSIDCFAPVYLPDDGSSKVKKRNAAVKRQFEFYKTVSTPAGILAMSPDPQFTDSVYKLAKARGLKVKRLDPEYTQDGQLKEGCVGFNPLYIRPGLPEWQYNDLVTKRASVISDTLISINQKYGSQDPYFASVNETQTVNAVKLLILTYPDKHGGMQPTLYDVYDLLSDFGKFLPLLKILVKKYAVNRQGVRAFPDDADPDLIDIEVVEKQRLNCGIWHPLFTSIAKNLISKSLKEIEYDHGRGLRNQFDKIISPQQMQRIFKVQNSLDLDRALEDGDIIIVNYSKASLGESNSSALGQFFLLSYIQAVMARPLDGRFLKPTWVFIDEYPQIMSPDQTVMFELFRKFRVGVNIIIQDLKQLDMRNAGAKNPLPVIKSNARQKIVFAVSDPDDADYYSRLSGTMYEPMEQNTIAETSLSNRDPSYSWSQRTTMQKVPRVESSDLIWQDFGEAYVYSVCDGSPVRPFQIQTSFLSESEWLGVKYPKVLWERCARDEGVNKKAEEDNESLMRNTPFRAGLIQQVKKPAARNEARHTFSCGKKEKTETESDVPNKEYAENIMKDEAIKEDMPKAYEQVPDPCKAVTLSDRVHGAMDDFLSLGAGGNENA